MEEKGDPSKEIKLPSQIGAQNPFPQHCFMRELTSGKLDSNSSHCVIIISRSASYDTKSTSNKSKNGQMRLPRFKDLYAARETINRVKRQPTEWEKIPADHISDRRLISRIYKEPLKVSNKINK